MCITVDLYSTVHSRIPGGAASATASLHRGMSFCRAQWAREQNEADRHPTSFPRGPFIMSLFIKTEQKKMLPLWLIMQWFHIYATVLCGTSVAYFRVIDALSVGCFVLFAASSAELNSWWQIKKKRKLKKKLCRDCYQMLWTSTLTLYLLCHLPRNRTLMELAQVMVPPFAV